MKNTILFPILLLLGIYSWAQLDLTFDYSNPDLTLSYLANKKSVNMDDLLANHGTQAILKKIHMDETEARKVLESAHSASPLKSHYQLSVLMKEQEQLRKLVATLKSNDSALRETVTSVLAKYVPSNRKLPVTVHYILGGYSSGFTFGDDAHLYIGLHHYQLDVSGIENTCLHEVFHNVQRANYDLNTITKELQSKDLGLTYAYVLLAHMFMEGTADFVADFRKLEETPSIKEQKDRAAVNNGRASDVFYLVSQLVVQARQKPESIDLNAHYSILMDWAWHNPGYFAGYKMTEALVNKSTREDALKHYLGKDPVHFFADYITLSRNQNSNLQFSAEFEGVVNELLEYVESRVE
jgi:hypothetical protein